VPTIESILAAEATLRAARVTVSAVHPGDRVIIHRALPGEVMCTLSSPATVVSALNLHPGRIYPEPWWEVSTLLDTGEMHNFNCSGAFSLLRADPAPFCAEHSAHDCPFDDFQEVDRVHAQAQA
jgi:hypothetical protein